VTEEEGEMGRGVGDGLAGKLEAAAVGEDEGEGLGARFVGGWRGGYVDFEEGGGGSAAIGVEGGDGETAGGAESRASESAGVIVGEEGLNLSCGAAGFSERHSYTKTESGRFGNHGVGLSLTLHNGDKPSGESISRHLGRVIEALPKTVDRLRARAESGFYCWEAVKAYTEWKCEFVIVARKTDRLLGELQAADWRSSTGTDADFECQSATSRRVGSGSTDLWACAMTSRSQMRSTRIRLDFSMAWLAATACL
jgi:hypothetical protein